MSATIAARDPAALAQRWATVLGLEAPQRIDSAWRLSIEGGLLTFASSPDGAERIVAFEIQARGRTLPVEICGTTFSTSEH